MVGGEGLETPPVAVRASTWLLVGGSSKTIPLPPGSWITLGGGGGTAESQG